MSASQTITTSDLASRLGAEAGPPVISTDLPLTEAAPLPAPPAASHPAWVSEIVDRFRAGAYSREDGLLMISVEADGTPRRRVPVIADFGDVLPFLEAFGAPEIVDEQLRLAEPHLWHGLYQRDGRVRVFLNHDWLLGLLDLARQREDDPELLRRVRTASRALRHHFHRGGFLIDEVPPRGWWARWFWPASPFNGGMIELWTEEAERTGDAAPLRWATELAEAWTGTATFTRHGVFEPRHAVRVPALQRGRRRLSTMRARLFKDNTNLVWGLLALAEATRDPRWTEAVERWLDGFTRTFYGAGLPFAFLDRRLVGYRPTLKAAFSSLDLLVGLHQAGVGQGRALDLAREIADVWLGLRWPNGLFPAHPGADRDHLDANVDMAVALVHLAAADPDAAERYTEAAHRCRDAVLAHHAAPAGYVLAVDRDGQTMDGRVLVKYQTLLTKLALLPEDPARLGDDPGRLALLRDR
ncbi:MAG: hypothetical protein AAF791_14120 [Bacteroidota bacterium]